MAYIEYNQVLNELNKLRSQTKTTWIKSTKRNQSKSNNKQCKNNPHSLLKSREMLTEIVLWVRVYEISSLRSEGSCLSLSVLERERRGDSDGGREERKDWRTEKWSVVGPLLMASVYLSLFYYKIVLRILTYIHLSNARACKIIYERDTDRVTKWLFCP